MDSKKVFKAKIVNQLSKWKTTIDGLKTHIEQAEVDAKVKLHDQLELLHDKRVKAEKILEDISATSQDAWEQATSGVEQAWADLTRTAKNTMAKVREAIAKPKHDEDIRQIAYKLWQEEGCPDGRHLDHWFKAEAIWRARQEAAQPDQQPRPKAKRTRKKTVVPTKTKSRAAKNQGRRGNQSTTGNKEP
jgi:uncharacterized protein YoxC